MKRLSFILASLILITATSFAQQAAKPKAPAAVKKVPVTKNKGVPKVSPAPQKPAK